jgi:hypothetical protein
MTPIADTVEFCWPHSVFVAEVGMEFYFVFKNLTASWNADPFVREAVTGKFMIEPSFSRTV